MYKLINPKISIPVHGEKYHLYEHCKFAKSLGIETVINIANGDCYEVDERGLSAFKVDSGYVAVDGNSLLPVKSDIIRVRRKLSDSGVIIILLKLNSKGVLKKVIDIKAPGLFCSNKDKDILDYLADHILKNSKSTNTKSSKLKQNHENIINTVRSNVKNLIAKSINKYPLIEVLISQD